MRSALTRRSPLIIAALAAVLALSGAPAALALDEPTVPEPVATYFATGLVPRLADLYGPGKKTDSGIVFDSSAKVGDIHRIFAWSAAYLAGKKTDAPIELTNNWLAPVSVKDQVAGLATVWINPSSDDPELANFDLGPGLETALSAAPKGTVLVRDDRYSAWFATDGTKLYPLVSGSSGIATQTTIAAYQKRFPKVAPSAAVSTATTNQGLLIAGIVLGVVVLGLAAFVLLPDRGQRRAEPAAAALVANEPAVVDEPVADEIDEHTPEPLAPKPAPKTIKRAAPRIPKPKPDAPLE